MFEWSRRLPWTVFGALDVNTSEQYFLRWSGVLLLLDRMPHIVWKCLLVGIVIAIWAVMIRNYRTVTEPDLRRRIRWLILGLVVALLPQTVVYAGVALQRFTGFGFRMDSAWFPNADELAAANVGIVLPFCLGYAVLRHRLLDIHIAIRTGIRYLMTKRVLEAAIFLPITLIGLRVILNPRLTVRDLLFGNYFYFGLILAAALTLAYRRQLLTVLDRKFFQEAYDQE